LVGVIRLPANGALQERIGYLLNRPVGRPPNEARRSYASFTYQAASWRKPRRAIAKIEWRRGELHPRVGFIVANMARLSVNVAAFYDNRGARENGFRKARARSDRRGCRAVRSPLAPLVFNVMRSPTALATSRARWRRSSR
jgi:hypothetical protein